MSILGTAARPVRIAIVGAGPSGFYAAGALVAQDTYHVSVDLIERLVTPFGLVRDGVAPDHQKIKRVTAIYDQIARHPSVRYFGNVEFGEHLCHDDLREHYDQIIYAVGAPTDRRLGIPGEDLVGSEPATGFVGWYNGHPDYRSLEFDLRDSRAIAVIGNGNVAMDVTRILLKPADLLATTDIADHALNALRESGVEEIYMFGRRGPAQAAFTNPELREMGEIEGARVQVRESDLQLDPASQRQVEAERQAQRNLETLREFATRDWPQGGRTLHMRFFESPVEIVGEEEQVQAIRVERNRLEEMEDGYLKASGTGEIEEIPVDRVLRAIGYRGVPLPGVPFDERRGVLPNAGGRLLDGPGGSVVPGEYVVGWAKRGPSGVIGTNKPDAVKTVEAMLEDLEHLTPVAPARADPAVMARLVQERQPQVVSYEEWRLLNRLEVARGREQGRPRVKFATVEQMLEAIRDARVSLAEQSSAAGGEET